MLFDYSKKFIRLFFFICLRLSIFLLSLHLLTIIIMKYYFVVGIKVICKVTDLLKFCRTLLEL